MSRPRRVPPPARTANVQLALGGADRLVDELERTGGEVSRRAAADVLFALRGAPEPLVARLVDEVVACDARLRATPGGGVALASDSPGAATPLEIARFTVVDLETTGVGRTARIVEIGAVRLVGFEPAACFERLVDPGCSLPPAVVALTGLRDGDVRGAGPLGPALDSFLSFAAGSILVAHNARFDAGFLDRALLARDGTRLALPVLDTVSLARRLLAGRLARFDLATLAERFSTAVRPCHRALPDARATAEVLAHLLGRAQERGVETAEELLALAATAPERRAGKRRLAAAVPEGPGVYVLRDAHGQALYVGKASDLRSRTRSYFGRRPNRPAVEAALAALDRIDVAPVGSELEAALAELELIRSFRPPANVRSVRPERGVYLRLGLADAVPALTVGQAPRDDGALYAGPLRSRRVVDDAAAGLRDVFGLRTCRPRLPVDDGSCLRGRLGRCAAPCHGAPQLDAYLRGVDGLRRYLEGRGEAGRGVLAARMRDLAARHRFEEAERLRRQRRALDVLDSALAAIRRARSRSGLLLAADLDAARVRAVTVREGRVVDVRSLPRRGDPSAAVAGSLAALSLAATPPAVGAAGRHPAGAPLPAGGRAPGPWLAAHEHEAALVLAGAFAGDPADVVAVAALPGADRASLVRRVAEARARVPARVPLPAGRFARPADLRAVEPRPGAIGQGRAVV